MWKTIKSIGEELMGMGIDLHNLMNPTEDGRGWKWALEPSNEYTVRSLRRLIDNSLLPEMDRETEWIRWIPSKANVHL